MVQVSAWLPALGAELDALAVGEPFSAGVALLEFHSPADLAAPAPDEPDTLTTSTELLEVSGTQPGGSGR